MKKLLLFTIGAVISLGCNNLKGDRDYLAKLNCFNQEEISHFPRMGSYKSLSIEIDTAAYYNTQCIIVSMEVSEDRYNSIFREYSTLPLIENSSKNIEIVNSFLDGLHYPEPTTIFCGDPCINKKILDSPVYILPNFYFNDYADSTTATRLSNKFKHVNIEQKKGIFSNKIREDISTMPINYFHGCSKGISFNDSEKVIIYWTIIW